MSCIQSQQKTLEQLRCEASMQRKLVSECIQDMISYMDQNTEDDGLLNGIPNKKANPFHEKAGCIVV